MEPGEKCVCSFDKLYNAFGEKTEAVHLGMRLTVTDSMYIGGMRFYSFEQTPDNNWYMASAFTPLRRLN